MPRTTILDLPRPMIEISHPEYGYAAAPFPKQLRAASQPFAPVIARKQDKGYSRARSVYASERATMTKFFQSVHDFAPLLSEADILNLSTTCYMGRRSRAHAQPDEGRDVGTSNVIRWRPDILRAVHDDWAYHYQRVPNKDDLDLVLPTGTSLGWPYFMPDDAQGVRTLTLAMMALAIDSAKREGLSLADIYAMMAAKYGTRFIAPGWRYQHSAKPMPVFDASGMMWTTNVEFRTRLIAMVDKVGVIYNRRVAKRAVKTALLMKQHDQRRPVISETFERWKRVPNSRLVAVDVSGFDNGFGGDNLLTLLKTLDSLFGNGKEYLNLAQEVQAPMLVPFGKTVFETWARTTPQLPSGASFTTAVGLLASDYIVRLLLYHAGVSRGDGPHQADWLSWGDDIVIRFPEKTDVELAFQKVSDEMFLKFDFEPTLKYLGFDYGSGAVQTNGGYSLGRLLQKSVFPESMTMYPYSIIGYAARLQFVNSDARRFHDLFTRHFWDPIRYGPAFNFDAREAVLQKALSDAMNEPHQNRDTLNFLLHGLDPIEGASMLESIDFDFTQWVGRSYIDFSDPERVALNGDPNFRRLATAWIPAIRKSGIRPFMDFISALSLEKGWRSTGGVIS